MNKDAVPFFLLHHTFPRHHLRASPAPTQLSAGLSRTQTHAGAPHLHFFGIHFCRCCNTHRRLAKPSALTIPQQSFLLQPRILCNTSSRSSNASALSLHPKLCPDRFLSMDSPPQSLQRPPVQSLYLSSLLKYSDYFIAHIYFNQALLYPIPCSGLYPSSLSIHSFDQTTADHIASLIALLKDAAGTFTLTCFERFARFARFVQQSSIRHVSSCSPLRHSPLCSIDSNVISPALEKYVKRWIMSPDHLMFFPDCGEAHARPPRVIRFPCSS